MDASSASIQPQQPSSANQPSSTGPQIRSRITVVCAECKRLKLKCDRRAPCGSCTKRGTVERCIYSPAAAEKVDLHSLNNRLMQVEATLALVTSGQNTPAFQSTYPLAHLSNASSSFQNQGSHQHHHHYAVPTLHNTYISLSHQDLSLWLEGLDLGVSLPSSSLSGASSSHQHNTSLAGTSGCIKLEPSPFEIELTHPRSSTTADSIAIDMDEPQTLSGNTTKSLLTSRMSPPLKRNARLHTPSHQQLQSQSQQQQQQRHSAQLSLPALSIYYPVPSINPPGTSVLSASTFDHHPPSSSSTIRTSTSPATPPPSSSASSSPYTFPAHPQSPQYSKPQVTPALIALLPALPTCKRFLNHAKEVFRVRPVPFEPGNGWVRFEKRCISLLSGGNLGKKERHRDKDKEREKEKAREAKRARQIYFSGIPELQSLHQRNDNLDGGSSSSSNLGGGRIVDEGGGLGEEEENSLAFFAVMCAVLAVGSHCSPSNQGSIPAENPAFFFALSQQALGVWDTHTSSSGNTEEREQMDFLLASLIGVAYLMLSGSSATTVGEDKDKEGTKLVYPLVGKMVNAARGMGLGRDSPRRKSNTSDGDASASPCRARSSYQTNQEKETERERLWEDWKLLMWWDIMFYDLFIADSLGHQPYVPSYTYTTKLPGCASDATPSVIPADPDNDGFDTEDEEPEYSYGHGIAMQPDDFDSRTRYRPTINSSSNGSGATESDEEVYFGARCRLTRLAQTIKQRMAHPECCCGYTLDQAALLENEIRRWQSDLAPSIKRSGVSSGEDMAPHAHPPPYGSDLGGQQDKPAASLLSQIQSCELALIANLLMFRIHAPFLHAASQGPPTCLSQPTKAGTSTSQLNVHAAQSTVHVAQSILRTARSLHVALGSSTSPISSPILPSMLDFYPLEKMVLDSIIICANVAFSTKSFPSLSTGMFDANALMDDVICGLDLLSELRAMAEPHRKIMDALYKKVSSHRGTNLLKRKYDQVDMNLECLTSSTMTPNAFNNAVVGGSVGDGIIPGFDGSQYQRSDSSVTLQQQSKAVDLSSTFSPPAPSTPISSSGLHDHQQKHAQRQKKSDNGDLISAITTAASARLAAAAAERESEKGKDKSGKTAKKSHPSVGIRVRVAKDGSVIRPQRAQATAGTGGQMQAPPLTHRPNAEAVLAFQQQQKQKLQAAITTQPAHTITSSQNSQTSSHTSSPGNMDMMHEHRSRSSSFSLAQPQQQLQPLDINSQSMDAFVSSPEQMDIQGMPPTKDYGIHDTNCQRQHSRHQPFGSAHMFEQTQTQPQPLYEQSQASFDHSSSGASADGMSYNQVSSPFSNGSGAISASSSPFTTSSGHPPTPTFPSHHSTPPVFGPTSTTSPAAYFHGSSSFTSYATNSPTQSSSLATLQPHGNSSDMPLMDMGMDPSMMTPVLENPIYDKSQQQHAMYDPKPAVLDNMSRHHQQQQRQQHQHFQRSSYDDGSQNHRHMVPAAPPWSSPPPPHQQQQSSMSAQNGQPFWNNGEGFKFYS